METGDIIMTCFAVWLLSLIALSFYYGIHKGRNDLSSYVVSAVPVINSIITIIIVIKAVIKEFKTIFKDDI